MRLSRFLPRAAVVACLVATGLAALPASPSSATVPSWPDGTLKQALWGFSWNNQNTGVLASMSVPATPPGPDPEFLYAPIMYAGGVACFELGTDFHSNGNLYLSAYDWCGPSEGWHDNAKWLIDATWRAKYVTNGRYTLKVERIDAPTNTWAASLLNLQTGNYDVFYTKGGAHIGNPSGGWNYYEAFGVWNPDTGVSKACDRYAGLTHSSKVYLFKINGNWVNAGPSTMQQSGGGSPQALCPGMTTAIDLASGTWSVTNPPLACQWRPTSSGGGGSFTTTVRVKNPNAYHVKGWKLRLTLPAGQVVTQTLGASSVQSGTTLTVTNSAASPTITSTGEYAFQISGTTTGSVAAPSAAVLDTGFSTATCSLF